MFHMEKGEAMAAFNDKYLRVPEFAAENGVSVATVYRWWAAGEGPKSTRLGPKSRVIAREDAEAWKRSLQD
jgi:predicted DNA-binding transcriptional regulator AlpA